MEVLAYALGSILLLASLIDIYLTILYARSGTGLLSPSVSRAVWFVFRKLSFLGKKDVVLSFCGPTLLLVLILIWISFIIAGFALLVWPNLGSSLQDSIGPTPRGFLAACYYSGYNFTTLGLGPIEPQTGFFRILAVAQAATGFGFFTLVITYFLSVYNALRRRNTFALTLHHKGSENVDAAGFVRRLGSGGDFQGAYSQIMEISRSGTDLLESYHLYPVLHYFRIRETQYAMPRVLLMLLNTASLLKTLPDEERYRSLLHSAALHELWTASMNLLLYLSREFSPEKIVGKPSGPSAETLEEWRKYYFSTAESLRKEEIALTSDLEKGAEKYLSLRKEWDPILTTFLKSLLFERREVFP
jgi:hypothetical protein